MLYESRRRDWPRVLALPVLLSAGQEGINSDVKQRDFAVSTQRPVRDDEIFLRLLHSLLYHPPDRA